MRQPFSIVKYMFLYIQEVLDTELPHKNFLGTLAVIASKCLAEKARDTVAKNKYRDNSLIPVHICCVLSQTFFCSVSK